MLTQFYSKFGFLRQDHELFASGSGARIHDQQVPSQHARLRHGRAAVAYGITAGRRGETGRGGIKRHCCPGARRLPSGRRRRRQRNAEQPRRTGGFRILLDHVDLPGTPFRAPDQAFGLDREQAPRHAVRTANQEGLLDLGNGGRTAVPPTEFHDKVINGLLARSQLGHRLSKPRSL